MAFKVKKTGPMQWSFEITGIHMAILWLLIAIIFIGIGKAI